MKQLLCHKAKFWVIMPVAILIFSVIACKNGNNNNTTKVDTDNAAYFSNAALKDITASLIKDPANADLYYKRGMMLHKIKEDTLAIKDFKKATTIDSTRAEYFSAIGDIYFEHKDITGALIWIKKAIQLNPKDTKAHLKICKALLYSQKLTEAMAEANLVLRQDVYNPEGYFLKGMCYKLGKDTDKAIGNFETAVQVSPDFKDAVEQLGLLYSARKNPLALKYLDNVYKLDSTDVFPVFARGVYFQNNNQFDEAKEEYKKCIAKDMRYVDAYFNIGWILMKQDSVEKAFRQYDMITKIDRMNPAAYYDRGVCNENLNKLQDAISDYKQALRLDTTYESPKMALKRLKAN